MQSLRCLNSYLATRNCFIVDELKERNIICCFFLQIYDFDRDYKDVGVAKFTTKYFVVRNCLPNAKSDMLLSAWNAPAEWGKYVTISVYSLLCMLHIYTV